MVTSGLVGCLALWTLQIATLLSIGCTKRKPQKNEKRRSLNSWRCFVAAKRSILAESYVARVRDDSENRFQSPGRVRSWPTAADVDRAEDVRSARVLQTSICSAIARASSTSMPRYLTVLSI